MLAAPDTLVHNYRLWKTVGDALELFNRVVFRTILFS